MPAHTLISRHKGTLFSEDDVPFDRLDTTYFYVDSFTTLKAHRAQSQDELPWFLGKIAVMQDMKR